MRFIFTEMIENQIHYDHTFSTYEHKPGTNLYSFQYPEHWRSSSLQNKSVMVRSVRVIPAARDINIYGLELWKEIPTEKHINISFSIYLASNEDMNALTLKFDNDIKKIFDEYAIDIENSRQNEPAIAFFAGRDYRIDYSYSLRALRIYVITNNMYLKFKYEDDGNGGNSAVNSSNDFCSILNLPDGDLLFKNIGSYQNNHLTKEQFDNYIDEVHGNNVLIRFKENTKELKNMVFRNVWNRSDLIISSSLSSLSENKYLMISNTNYNPPKMFEISGFNKGFDINLIELGSQKDIMLPDDGKDKIVVEMILVAA